MQEHDRNDTTQNAFTIQMNTKYIVQYNTGSTRSWCKMIPQIGGSDLQTGLFDLRKFR